MTTNQYIDITAQKEYTYSYEDGRITRAAECDIAFGTDEIVTSKVLVSSVLYTYDAEGTLTRKRIRLADGTERTVWFETTDDNTVAKLEVSGKTVTSHSKTDSFGRKVFDELQLGTGFVSRQFSYHAGAVTEAHKENGKLKSSPTTQLVSQIVLSDGRTLSYEYDAEERITKVTDSLEKTTTEYTYDALGQLLTETVDGEVVNVMKYDNYGNILQKNGACYTYNEVWKDRLDYYCGEEITYDAQGNPLNYLGHTLTWEKGRQLKSFDGIAYTYNANGIRTSKTVDGIRHDYLLDGVNILRETWCGNTLETLYDNEESVCGIVYNKKPYFFLKNLQGDIIAIADQNGEVVASYTYDAWGVCTIRSDTSGCSIAAVNPYRYRGYYFDTETGLYYLQSRYYNPEAGRWLNSDEVEFVTFDDNVLAVNLFSYVKNMPVDLTDGTGNAWWFDFNFKPLLPGKKTLKKAYQYITTVIKSAKKKALSTAKVYLKKALQILKKKIRITVSAINRLIRVIRSIVKILVQVIIKTIVMIVIALVVMCVVSIKVAKVAWDWLTKTKAGQITFNAVMLVVSLAGLILSIIGCASPASPVAIAGVVVSAISLFGSLLSLIMAIFS